VKFKQAYNLVWMARGDECTEKEKASLWRTRAVEDFLRTVYGLQQTTVPVPTTLISRALHIAPPSVTDMIRRLAVGQSTSEPPSAFCPPMRLVDRRPYCGVRLTAAGEKVALQVLRRRRLLELYLEQRFGYAWDEVDGEADRLEHDVSEHFTERLATVLGNPIVDPHGDPIPTADGSLPTDADDITLTKLAVRQQGQITRISNYSPTLLRYLGNRGLRPGVWVRMIDQSPVEDTVTVRADGETCTLSVDVANHLHVTCEQPQPDPQAAAVTRDSRSTHRIRHSAHL
jgi:DtxR family Mn-dependent transcriptional regulator